MKRRGLAGRSLALALVLVLVMLMVLVGCTKDDQNTESVAENSSEAVTTGDNDNGKSEQSADAASEDVHLTILVLETGVQWNTYPDNDVAKEIAKQTGVTFEFIESDDSKYKVMIESGDLTDIIRTNYSQFGNQLIEGNHIIPLDDLLETNGTNIKNNLANAINYLRENASNGQNKLYYVPVQVASEPTSSYKADIGATIRWDYYKEIGAPEINTIDDLLSALEKMQSSHPENAEGKKVYGLSSFNDWSAGMWCYDMMTYFLSGERMNVGGYMIQADNLEGYDKYKTTTSGYWKTIELYYKANQMGLLDPDAMIMKYDDYMQKATEGRILFGPSEWAMGSFNEEHNGKVEGYITIPVGSYSWTAEITPLGWDGKNYAITTNCEVPDRAMDLLDFIASYDGARIMYSGVEGVNWEMVDGKPVLKDSTIELKKTGSDEFIKTGIGLEQNFIGLGGGVINPADGTPVNLFRTPEVFSLSQTALEKDFCDFYNVSYPMQIFEEKNASGEIVGHTSAYDTDMAFKINTLPQNTMPDDIKTIEANVKEVAVKYAAKLVYAKDDAEFEELKAEFFNVLDEETEFSKYAEYCANEWEYRLTEGGLK